MAAEKDAELSEVTRLRQHPNRSCPASTQTTEQTKNCCRGVLILVIFAGSRKTKVNGYKNSLRRHPHTHPRATNSLTGFITTNTVGT